MVRTRRFFAVDILGAAFAVALVLSFAFVPVAKAEPPNTAPEVDSLVSTLDTLFPTQSCELRCTAHDADGDPLSVKWTTSGGTMEIAGFAARWTAPERAGSYSVMAEVRDDGDGYDAAVLVLGVTANNPPVIESLSAEPELVLPGGTVRLSAGVTDPDGHALGYEWSSSAGTLAGIGAGVDWTAPSTPGSYPVSLKTYDGLGGETFDSVTVVVAPPDPPVIESLIVRPLQPAYTKVYDWCYRLLRGKLCECELECVASAAGKELFYEWSATGGSIEGSGPTVLFIPPNKTVEVTVTVTVKDAFGNSASDDALFKVFLREQYPPDKDEVPGGCQCGG